MSFRVLPPEVNSALMFAGPGSGPMLAAASAWEKLAAELTSAAALFASATSALPGQTRRGPASAVMAATADPYSEWLRAAAAQTSGVAMQAIAVASEYESALAATVHPAMLAANRSHFAQLVLSNLLGQNAPAIAAAESDYEQMWAQDVSAMYGYHAGATAAANEVAQWQQWLQILPGLLGLSDPDATPGDPGSDLGLGNTGNWKTGTEVSGFLRG
jgi:PPE-repeat protein